MNRHQSADHIGALFASLLFTCKEGNLFYTLCLAIIGSPLCIALLKGIRYNLELEPTLPAFPSLALLALFLMLMCKTVDNAARIRAGWGRDPVPFSPFRTDSAHERYIMGFFLLSFIAAALDFTGKALGIPFIGQVASPLLFAILTPAIILSFLNNRTIISIVNPLQIMAAITSIGILRYIVMFIMVSIISGSAFYLLLAIANSRAIYGRLRLAARAMDYSDGDASFLYLFAACALFAFFFIKMLADNYCAFLYPRPETDDSEIDEDDLDDSAILATLSAAGMTPPATQNTAPVPSNHLPPADLSLLQDADTSSMDMDTQQAFARALAEADAHIRSGAPDKAIPILAAWTTTRQDIAAYFPAYARLYPLDPQPALRSRLLEAAARGNSKSYRLIAAELASLDPADIPVNHILPLVQLAAKAQEYRSVINLTRNFGKAHPDHPHLVENYYHSARALAKLGATDKATALLTQLLTRYPEHPKAAHIRYALDQLGGKT